MTSYPTPVPTAPFGLDDRALAGALDSVLAPPATPPGLLALGEPAHGEPAFPLLRNRLLALLVERGFRSIALETDAVAALEVDAYVRGGPASLDTVMATGFSHGFGDLTANRELVAWLRTHNDVLPPSEHVTFHGFDAPLEMSHAPSPRRYLTDLHHYLLDHLGPAALPRDHTELDRLLGDDGRWSDPAAQFDAAVSIGASPEARALRVLADDLEAALHAGAPRLVAATSREAWHAAAVRARAARGLLRYHAQAAEPGTDGERVSRMLGVRDALMAQNLCAVRARERHRGPTFVFAQNSHLQRHPSRWRLAEMDLEWAGAGSIVAALGGERYTVVTGSLGASTALGLGAPGAGTFEGALEQATGGSALVADLPTGAGLTDPALRTRTDATPEQGYFPLTAETLERSDAVLHVAHDVPDTGGAAPTDIDLAARILRDLPGVTHLRIGAEHEAAAHSLGDWFFFAGDDRRMPFATIVVHDTPGFDTESALDRPGVFRLNLGVGRAEFEHLFGFGPAELAQRGDRFGAAAPDLVVPHHAYGRQGWVGIVCPSAGSLGEIDRLLTVAHGRRSGR